MRPPRSRHRPQAGTPHTASSLPGRMQPIALRSIRLAPLGPRVAPAPPRTRAALARSHTHGAATMAPSQGVVEAMGILGGERPSRRGDALAAGPPPPVPSPTGAARRHRPLLVAPCPYRAGGLLALMLIPQLWVLARTRSAHDLSHSFMALFNVGGCCRLCLG